MRRYGNDGRWKPLFLHQRKNGRSRIMAKFDFIKKIKKKKEVTDTQSNNEFSEKNSERRKKFLSLA